MKVKITKNDGTIYDIEGTEEEVNKILDKINQPITQFVPIPYQPYIPSYPNPILPDINPYWPWTITCCSDKIIWPAPNS